MDSVCGYAWHAASPSTGQSCVTATFGNVIQVLHRTKANM